MSGKIEKGLPYDEDGNPTQEGWTPIDPSRVRRFVWEPEDVDILTEEEARLALGDEVIDAAKRTNRSLSDSVEALVAEAVEAAARAITDSGGGLQHPFREREFQGVLVSALKGTLAKRDGDLCVRPNLGVRFPDWPGVGPVDVAIVSDASPPTFLELKWGLGTLYNCIWDLAKLAAAVTGYGAAAGYLIAGAPKEDWEGSEESELFLSGTTQLVELFRRYPNSWLKWCREVKTHPIFLPLQAQRSHVSTTFVRFREEDWELRCLRVSQAAENVQWWCVPPLAKAVGACEREGLVLQPSPDIDVVSIDLG